MFSYALKRVTRSTWLFAALFLGVILASTFFAGINVGADTTAKAALDQQLDQIVVDITVSGGYSKSLSSADWLVASELVASVDGVVASEVITRVSTQSNERYEGFPPVAVTDDDYIPFTTVGIANDSRVYDGLEVVSGASSLQENETYVWVDSEVVDEIEIGDVLPFNYSFSGSGSEPETVSLNLTVAGFVSLDEEALAILSGMYFANVYFSDSGLEYISIGYPNLLLTDWEKTFAKLVDTFFSSNSGPMYSPFRTEIVGFLDRDTVINPWSVDVSRQAISLILLRIENELAEFDLSANSNLEYTLMDYQALSMSMRLNFVYVALPVLFVAWYVGSTVSHVSFNLRRREIGLLSAKGFSSGQLLRLFLSESLLIGIIGGLIGVGLSFVLSPFFIPSLGPEFGGLAPVVTLDLIIIVVVFSTILTLLSTFLPARRSARLSTLDALREHLYVEETKAYKQKLPMLALFLGSYKIGMTLLGIPYLAQYFGGSPPWSSNIFLTILFAVWFVIDAVITPVGPILFFWGFTKTLIGGSSGFQKLVSVFSKFLGDIGTLATKNVKRNPVRAASVAFLVALIIGYSFLTVGTLASEEDYVVRQVKADVGADIRVSLNTIDNVTAVTNNITSLQGISSTVLEYEFYGQASRLTLKMKAVEPQDWLSTAYYETEWFSGQSVTASFQEMANDNNTIVLAQGIADSLGLEINDYITVTIDDATSKLRVVGFFGSAYSMEYQILPGISSRGNPVQSYVPYNFYNSTDADASGKLLVNLEPNVNATQVAAQIRDIDSDDIGGVSSVEERLAHQEIDLTLSGTMNIQRIGVIFAVVAASVATALVALVSLQERKKEVAIMNIRGLSYRQVSTMLLTEVLSVVIFATVIGCVVGVIMVHGNTVAANADTYASLVSHRMVFPPDAILTLAVMLLLVFLSTILPVILITRRYVSKLERIVRS